MTDFDALADKHRKKLAKALVRLSTSFAKVASLPTDVDQLNDAQLEVWESFMARFGRASDVFLSKLLRTLVLQADPGYSGSFRDTLNQAAKLRLIDEVEPWLAIRELRNVWAHEYAEEALGALLHESREKTPLLLALPARLAL